MATHANRELIALYNLKTKRQKRRALKEDKEKQLLALYNRSNELYEAQQSLPMVPLKEPFQQGWKRTFVLNTSLTHSDNAEFYERLLDKINYVQYCRDRQFRYPTHRKKNGVKQYKMIEQPLAEYGKWDWQKLEQKLSEKEKVLFQQQQRWDSINRRYYTVYIFTESWRYQLIVTDNIIYEVREEDTVLKQMESELDKYLTRGNLWSEIFKVKDGFVYNRKGNCLKKRNTVLP